MEKLTFVLVTAARKLKPYFQAHIVVVLTNKPLRRAMSNPDTTGRLALWAIELSELDIQYRPQTAIKGQVVADFIAKFTHDEDKEQKNLLSGAYIQTNHQQAGQGAGVILRSPEGDTVDCMAHLDYPTTNNEAKYEALVAGLDLAKVAGATSVVIYCDS